MACQLAGEEGALSHAGGVGGGGRGVDQAHGIRLPLTTGPNPRASLKL